MERFAILVGLTLCALTLLGLLLSPFKAAAIFVPVLFGIPTLLCGVISLNPHRRRVGMGLAAVVAAVGAIVGGVEFAYLGFGFLSGDVPNRLSVGIVLAMSAICVLFVSVWVRVLWRSRLRPPQRTETRLGTEQSRTSTGQPRSDGD